MKPASRLTYLFTAMVGIIALSFSGCASQPPGPIPRGQNPVRTLEELRVARETLETLQAGGGAARELSVAGTRSRPVSFFLNDEEAALLKAADRGQTFEIRYWYHTADFGLQGDGDSPFLGFNQMVEDADLESVRDGETVLIDRTRCRVHHQIMTRRPVTILYGLPMRTFVEALHNDFPHAPVQLGGCVIDNTSAHETPDYVCPACEVAYQAWRQKRDKDTVP